MKSPQHLHDIQTILCVFSEEIWILLKFLTPMGLFSVYFIALARLNGVYFGIAPLMFAYIFPPLGKESVIPAGIAMGITPSTMFLLIVAIDLLFAVLIIWNYELIYKMPFFGKVLMKIEDLGMKAWEKRTWASDIVFIGLIVFVFIPFHGTGATTSAVIGRAVGIRPLKVFIAIVIGSITGASFVIAFSDMFRAVFGKVLLSVLVIIIIGIVLYRVIKRRGA